MRITLYIEECESIVLCLCVKVTSKVSFLLLLMLMLLLLQKSYTKKRREKNWLELLHYTSRLDYLGSVVAADKASNVRRDNNR